MGMKVDISSAGGSGGGGSNAANGSTGTTAPTTATEVGGVNAGTGNLVALAVDSSGNAGVNVQSSTLPSGAATSALQTSGNASLTTLAANVPAQGQALAAASMPVVLPAAQVTALTPPATVAVTQATAASLNMTDATGALAQGSAAAGAAASKSVLAGLVYNSTTPTLTNGQQVAAQADANGNLEIIHQDLLFTGQAAQTALVNNIIPAASGASATNAQGFRSATIQINSTGTAGGYIFEGSNDNANFFALTVYNAAVLTGTPINAAVVPSAANLLYIFPITTQYIRVRISTAVTGGSIQAFTRLSQATWTAPVTQVAQATAANLNVNVGTLPTLTTVTTVTNTTNNGTTYTNADIASAAITTTTNGGTVTVANGTSVAFNVAITASSGTTPTYDFSVQESGDGTNWLTIYQYPRQTTTGFFTTPSIKLNHNRYRVVETIGGTTPSFTRAVTSSRTAGSNVMERNLIDRTINPATGSSTTASLYVDGCTTYGMILLLGAGGTGNIVVTLDGSDDGANWVNGVNFVNVVAASATPVQCAYSGARFRWIRARVTTAQVSSSLSYCTLYATQDTLQTLPGRKAITNFTIAASSLSTTYTQILAATVADTHVIETFESAGFQYVIGVGASGSEITQVYIFPGGSGQQPLFIPAGSRIAVKTTAGTPTSGQFSFNAYSA